MSQAHVRPTRNLRPRHCTNCTDDRPARSPTTASTKRKKEKSVAVYETRQKKGGAVTDTRPQPQTQQLVNPIVDEEQGMVTLVLIPVDPCSSETCSIVQWPAMIDLEENIRADIDLSDGLSSKYSSPPDDDSDHSFSLQIDEDDQSEGEDHVGMDNLETFSKCNENVTAELNKGDDCISFPESEVKNASVAIEECKADKTVEGENVVSNDNSEHDDDDDENLENHDTEGSSMEDEEGRNGCVEDDELPSQHKEHVVEDRERLNVEKSESADCNEDEETTEDDEHYDDDSEEEGDSEDDGEQLSIESNLPNNSAEVQSEYVIEKECTVNELLVDVLGGDHHVPDANTTQHISTDDRSGECSSGLTPGERREKRHEKFTMAENVLLCRMVCAQYATLMKRAKHIRAQQRKEDDWVNIAQKVSEVKKKERSGYSCLRRFQDCRRQVKEMLKDESEGEEVYYNEWQKVVKSTVIAYPRIGVRIVRTPYKKRKVTDVHKQPPNHTIAAEKVIPPEKQNLNLQKEASTLSIGKSMTNFSNADFVCSPAQQPHDTDEDIHSPAEELQNTEEYIDAPAQKQPDTEQFTKVKDCTVPVVEPCSQTVNCPRITDSSTRSPVRISNIDRRRVPDLGHCRINKQQKFIGTAELKQDEAGCFTNCTVFVSPQKQNTRSSQMQVVPFKPNEYSKKDETSALESRLHVVSRCSQQNANSEVEDQAESTTSIGDLVSPDFTVTVGIADKWAVHETFDVRNKNVTPLRKNHQEESESGTALERSRSDNSEIDITRKFLEIQQTTLQLLTSMSEGQKQMLENQKGMLSEMRSMNKKKKKHRKYRKHYSSDSQS